VEIALTLAIITLTTILLNAGVFWILLKESEARRRTDLALSLSTALAAQLDIEARSRDPAQGYRRVLSAYRGGELDFDELYVVDAALDPLAHVVGQPPDTLDAGFRAALYGREQHSDIIGGLWSLRWVAVTTPVPPRGRPVAALRVRFPLRADVLPGGPAVFVLVYTGFSGLAIAVFGFSLFRRRLIAPIARLQSGTSRIAGGGFGYQVEVDAARELQELCGALNAMSTSLAAYREQMATQVDSLEAANHELRQAQEALVRSEKLAGVGRLAAGLAHEIGNPLSVLLGNVELLQQGLGDPDLEHDLLDRSQAELERIHLIIRHLLDYARPGTGRPEAVAIGDSLAEAARTVGLQPAFRALTLSVEHPPDLPRVRIEPDKLHQVLVNLLLNAADAARHGDDPRVWLRAHPTQEGNTGVEIRCEDTGPGFDTVAMDRAFEPFFTTRDTGTGLGLATCLQVIEGAGGQITIGHRAGGGASVRIILPASPR